MAAHCLDAFGMHVQTEGLTLIKGSFAVTVVTECSVLQMALLFFSFVASSPVSLRKKITGLALGIPFLHAANVLRISALFAAGLNGPIVFQLCHVYLGQVLMILVVCVACLAWLRSFQPDANQDALWAFLARFVGYSGLLFLLWLPLNVSYVRLIDNALRPLFSLFDYSLVIPYRHQIYYQTFNVVAFAGLVLAGRSTLGRKMALLVTGLSICASLQLALRASEVLITSFHSVAAGRASLLICFVGEYLVPVLLWLLMRKGQAMPGILKLPFRRGELESP
jgi:exosortase H (IPTLxxWG-CTERM-specific)